MGRTKATETLTEYEPGRSLGYILQGDAGPFATARSRWSIATGLDGATEVTVEGHFLPKNWAARHLAWPLAKPMIVRLTRKVLDELAAHLAT